MPKSVGGRGKIASYKTIMVRTPELIKERVEELKELYFSGQLEYHDKLIAEDHKLANEYKDKLAKIQSNTTSCLKFTNRDEVIDLARSILKNKKSSRESLSKMLTVLLGENITVEDLK